MDYIVAQANWIMASYSCFYFLINESNLKRLQQLVEEKCLIQFELLQMIVGDFAFYLTGTLICIFVELGS